MVERDTLLAHLAPKYLTGRIEDAATDALAYILNKSECARSAFNDLVAYTAGVPVEDCDRFATQVVVSDDRARPDFVGYDKNGEKRVIGESKFWAPLGDEQVKAYLKQLPSSGPAVLLFVVPDTRIESLWPDVNCYVGREQQRSDRVKNGTVRVGVMPDNHLHRIMMMGWVDLLDSLAQATKVDSDVASEIKQLRGLAMKQDREAFLPLKEEELVPEIARRVINLVDLVDAAINLGRTDGWLNTDRLTSSRTGYWYARWFRFSGVEGEQWFGVDYRTWAMRGESPLWLWIYEVPEKLRGKLTVKLYDGGDGGTFVPIYLPIGVEREKVLDSVIFQLKDICGALKPAR